MVIQTESRLTTKISLLLVGLVVVSMADAGEVLKAKVTHQSGLYTPELDARITAPVPDVHRLLTAYNHLEQVNPAVKESAIIETYSPAHHRVRSVIEACVAFFCKRLIQVWDVEQRSNGEIVAAIVPEVSNFRFGDAHWVLQEENGGTHLQFTTRLEPAFWVPPLIGPWIIRYKLHQEGLESVENLERLARF
ncbi:MAG: hypothetical protein KDG50_00030 [Chromatiales bacterium]|nr:hypothetical protein [Chromatiales bacterium]